jgi:hypothetical protein
MNATRFVLLFGFSWAILAAPFGCGRASPTPLENWRAKDEARRAETAKALHEVSEALLKYEKRQRALEDESAALRIGVGEPSGMTPDWLKVERGMGANPRLMREGTTWTPWEPDLSNPRLLVRPGADRRD